MRRVQLLEFRRVRRDLIETYKILRDHDKERMLPLVRESRTKGHCLKFKKIKACPFKTEITHLSPRELWMVGILLFRGLLNYFKDESMESWSCTAQKGPPPNHIHDKLSIYTIPLYSHQVCALCTLPIEVPVKMLPICCACIWLHYLRKFKISTVQKYSPQIPSLILTLYLCVFDIASLEKILIIC